MNTLGKLSKSIKIIEEIRSHQQYVNNERGRMRLFLSAILLLSFGVSMVIMKCCIDKQKEKDERMKEAGIRIRESGDLVEGNEIKQIDQMTQQEIGEFIDKKFPDLMKED